MNDKQTMSALLLVLMVGVVGVVGISQTMTGAQVAHQVMIGSAGEAPTVRTQVVTATPGPRRTYSEVIPSRTAVCECEITHKDAMQRTTRTQVTKLQKKWPTSEISNEKCDATCKMHFKDSRWKTVEGYIAPATDY